MTGRTHRAADEEIIKKRASHERKRDAGGTKVTKEAEGEGVVVYFQPDGRASVQPMLKVSASAITGLAHAVHEMHEAGVCGLNLLHEWGCGLYGDFPSQTSMMADDNGR